MKPFTTLAIVLLGLIAILQLLRLALGWHVEVAGTVIPMWASILAAAVTGITSVMLWRESRVRGRRRALR